MDTKVKSEITLPSGTQVEINLIATLPDGQRVLFQVPKLVVSSFAWEDEHIIEPGFFSAYHVSRLETHFSLKLDGEPLRGEQGYQTLVEVLDEAVDND